MARRLGRSELAQETIGFLLATYLRLVQRTSRFTTVPADLDAFIKGKMPLIAAMWHGQHLMMPFARPGTMDRLAVLISRHEDAGAQALAAERLGITPVRGSGGPADRIYYKGGAPAMRELLRQLEFGRLRRHDRRRAEARARRRARHRGAGEAFGPSDRADGGRRQPPHPVQHLGSRHARIAVRAARSSSPAISSAFLADADEAAMEAARLAVEHGLDEAHRQGYAMVGATDPGADLRPA